MEQNDCGEITRFALVQLEHLISSLRLDHQIVAFELDHARAHGLLRGATEDGAGGYVKLAAVTGTRDRRAVELAFRERAPSVSALVVEGVDTSERAHDAHVRPGDVEDAQLVISDILCITDSYQHNLTCHQSD